MTELLDRAFKTASSLPPGMQDEIARLMLQWTGDEGAGVRMTEDESRAVAKSKAAAAQGDFASDAEVRDVWTKYGL
ncbi:MAG: hypothetical protein KGI37_04130 [Alphaproteobacteria bacterium]|nr:hypothetical protein [Alphaproteobacteria bacterium]